MEQLSLGEHAVLWALLAVILILVSHPILQAEAESRATAAAVAQPHGEQPAAFAAVPTRFPTAAGVPAPERSARR